MPSFLRTASLVLLTAAALPLASQAEDKPRLILQITVDQLRGDLVNRHAGQFGDGGFKYLLEQGVYYDNAHHTHANTETVVGHTTLATGAPPAAHGALHDVIIGDSLLQDLSLEGPPPRDVSHPEDHQDGRQDPECEYDPVEHLYLGRGRRLQVMIEGSHEDIA